MIVEACSCGDDDDADPGAATRDGGALETPRMLLRTGEGPERELKSGDDRDKWNMLLVNNAVLFKAPTSQRV